MNGATITAILDLGNLILASVNVIISFSLFVYILTHNFRSPVARAFCALMAFVSVVYIVDVGLAEVETIGAAGVWLPMQWIGIAFVPAAYYHFSDALLRTTGSISRGRRMGVFLGYLSGGVFLGLVLFTNLVIGDAAQNGHIFHLLPGPLFWVFTLYYMSVSLIGWLNITQAKGRCLTSTSRRRMSYLMLAFVAPSIGVFPYLLVPTMVRTFSPNLIAFLNLVGNVGIAMMTIVIGYIVAYQGVLLPDRVIKHSLIHYLLRGPLMAIAIIVIMLTIPRVENILGLPRDMIMIASVAGAVVTFQVLINIAKPAIDRVTYRQDRREIQWIQTLEQHLLTTTDLEQLLENTLIALCDLLRVPSGFVVTMSSSVLSIRVFCGLREAANDFLARVSLPDLLEQLGDSCQGDTIGNGDFILADGYWLLPLRNQPDEAIVGILGLRALASQPHFSEEDLEAVQGLVRRAEFALEDMRLQQQIFAILQGLGNELDEIQAWRSTPQYVGVAAQHLDASPVRSQEFDQMVKDALSQLWGGPKLTTSPLLNMRIVQSRLPQCDNVPAKAVRSVLQEAIERLKPDGRRSMTAAEWIVYNILDLKFIQGQRIRDIVQRLAMSESDFYRKQRIAVGQVAETLMQMERSTEKENPGSQTATDPVQDHA